MSQLETAYLFFFTIFEKTIVPTALRAVHQFFLFNLEKYTVFSCLIYECIVFPVRGNEMAQVEEYTAAIQLFTEAINLDQTDFR